MVKNKTSKWLFTVMKDVIKKQLVNTPFLSKKPNKNTKLEDGLAIMVMNMIRLFVEISVQVDKKNYEIAAILLRSLLEINANVQFLVKNNSEKMAVKFLKTAETASKNFYAIAKGRKSYSNYWTDVSITKRVSDLGKGELIMYKFLSSYAHMDAGLMAAYYLKYREYTGDLFLTYASLYCWKIIDNLSKHGVIEMVRLNREFIETVRTRLPELKD